MTYQPNTVALIEREVAKAHTAYANATNFRDETIALGTERGLNIALKIVKNEQAFAAQFDALGFHFTMPVVASSPDEARQCVLAHAMERGITVTNIVVEVGHA